FSSACQQVSSSGRPQGAAPAARPAPVPPLMARPAPSPAAPMDLKGVVSGISTDVNDPALVVRANGQVYRRRMAKDQSVKKYNLGDNVHVQGWPMGDGVMLATVIEVVYK